MSLSTNTAFRHRKILTGLSLLLVSFCSLSLASQGQDVKLRALAGVFAGTPASIVASGSGTATFYLVGPATARKSDIQLGQEISLSGKDLESAGRYLAIVCAATCNSVDFFVAPAKPATLTFLAHPSRVPVGQGDAISGVALPFDSFRNLVLNPSTVHFELTTKGGSSVSHNVQTQNGLAWFHTNSGKAAGALQLTASLDGVSGRRIVQQVASDPCNLRIKGQRTAKGVIVETDPIRDCSGNPVPDGTIVTFTARNGNEISTVDAPVKQDVARAKIAASGPLVISAASGVVMGNELHMGAQ
jgi:hypothetical protein